MVGKLNQVQLITFSQKQRILPTRASKFKNTIYSKTKFSQQAQDQFQFLHHFFNLIVIDISKQKMLTTTKTRRRINASDWMLTTTLGWLGKLRWSPHQMLKISKTEEKTNILKQFHKHCLQWTNSIELSL